MIRASLFQTVLAVRAVKISPRISPRIYHGACNVLCLENQKGKGRKRERHIVVAERLHGGRTALVAAFGRLPRHQWVKGDNRKGNDAAGVGTKTDEEVAK